MGARRDRFGKAVSLARDNVEKRQTDFRHRVPKGLGQGVNYWEPAWLNNTGLGSACQDAILFNVDWSQWPKVTAYSRPSVNIFKGV